LSKAFENYHKYLLNQNFKGKIYRNFFLYPTLRLITGPSFLDFGCGLGDFLKFGDKSRCIGIDVNPYNISYARSRGIKAELIKPGSKIPINSSSIKVAVADQVIEHLDSPNFFFKEMRRVLEKNGKLLIGVPCIKGYRHDPDHKIFYDKNKLKLILKENSFKVKYSFYLPIPIFFIGKFIKIQSFYILSEFNP